MSLRTFLVVWAICFCLLVGGLMFCFYPAIHWKTLIARMEATHEEAGVVINKTVTDVWAIHECSLSYAWTRYSLMRIGYYKLWQETDTHIFSQVSLNENDSFTIQFFGNGKWFDNVTFGVSDKTQYFNVDVPNPFFKP